MDRRAACIGLALLAASLIPFAVQTQSNPAVTGEWSAAQGLPYRPVHAALLPSGKVFFWASYADADNPQLWDPNTSLLASAAHAGYNIFCAGFCLLPNGRLFLAGGHESDFYGLPNAASYDPVSNSWTRSPDMTNGRWYPTATTLPSGDVLVVAGTIDTTVGMNPLPEVWQAATQSWRGLTTAQLELPYYPYMYVAPNGKVFNAGPNQTTRYLDTTGTGAWTFVANTRFGARNWGSSVMLEDGRVLLVGGSTCGQYEANCAYEPTETAEVLDPNAPSPVWQYVAPMTLRRKSHNATLLPDGTVLVTGGTAGTIDQPENAVFAAELWNPATNAWTTLASNSVYRGYHSTALLLPDGRVFAGGGDIGGPSAEIFSASVFVQGSETYNQLGSRYCQLWGHVSGGHA